MTTTNINVVSETQMLNVVANSEPSILGSMVTQNIVVPESQFITVDPITQQTVVAEILLPIIETSPVGSSVLLMSSTPSVTVTNSGPPGPSNNPSHPAQEAFNKANGLEERRIVYTDSLPSTITYYKNGILQYTATIVYTNSLPSVITLTNELTNMVFLKTILYENGLPIGVEWQTV